MKWPMFVIFQDDRRFQAGYLGISGDAEVLAFRGREYRFAGQVPFFHHLTGAEKELIGFVIDGVDNVKEVSPLLEWIRAGENKSSDDSYEAYFFLTWPRPDPWNHDCSAMNGANVYQDGRGDFLITISDTKATDKDGQFQNLWSSIGFPLAPADQFQVIKYFPEKS